MNLPSDNQETAVNQVAETLHDFEKFHKEDLEAILQVLVKITNRTPEQIKLHLDGMDKRFPEWVNSHRGRNFPFPSEEAISRESIYEERD